MAVPANRSWTDTGVDVTAGEAITVTAGGTVTVTKSTGRKKNGLHEIGPEGTYLYSDDVIGELFPLPSAAGGPAPPFCLIGRIDDGPAFFVGPHKSWTAESSGRLYLGINDFDVSDNAGEFTAKVTLSDAVQPVAYEETVVDRHIGGKPVPDSSLVVFYVDGLRPDVVREMSAMGHLPNISKLFLTGGTWVENNFTVFPSDTITSNGTMWTGCFSDRHGLKGQLRFSRRTLYSESYLSPLGPNRSSSLLAPQGIDQIVHQTQTAGVRILQGDEAGKRFSQTHVTGVRPLYAHLRKSGFDWATGVLPMMTEVPPILWTRSLVKHMPYFRAHQAWKHIDDANTDYTMKHLLDRKTPVTIVWLPETDTTSHKLSRGQFGMTRRTIAQADKLIGRIVNELAQRKRLKSTYLMLVSDHGHHGGRTSHLSSFDIANELFYRPRERTKDGRWVGGGLGMSVRQHRSWNRHSEDGSREFVFLDANSDGAARIFLPRGHFRSGQWMGERHPADMLRYRIAKNRPPVNLVNALTGWQATDGQGVVRRPVDLVLLKLSDHSILVATHDRGKAVIDRRKNAEGNWSYQYTPVKNLRPKADGTITCETVQNPSVDPLGIVGRIEAGELREYHDEQYWLRVTSGSEYPDSVVALTRHMLWQKDLKYREDEFAPDLVVTARRRWYFGTANSPGTMHGYPFRESMRATMFVAGPNIRRGARLTAPCRMVDLTPTILEMVGRKTEDKLDGHPIHGIYQPDAPSETVVAGRPVYWDDLDLRAWKPIEYHPVKPYPHQPITINQPSSPYDLNNVVYNALTLGELNVLRLVDDAFMPNRAPNSGSADRVEEFELYVRRSSREWAAEGIRMLDMSGVAVADYSLTSKGNLKRVDEAIDWFQSRGKKIDGRVARRVGREEFKTSRWLHTGIDAAQTGFWEVYRFGQRIVAQVVDESILNSLEDGTDRVINRFRMQPAEIATVRRVVAGLCADGTFEGDVAVVGISVAALMNVDWLERKLPDVSAFDRVILPGWCQGDVEALSKRYSVPFERGPKDIHALPEYFGRARRPPADLSRYDIEILAEINHAPRLPDEEILRMADHFGDSGADLIDLGCVPGECWNRTGEVTRMLRDRGHRVSIDSFERKEVEAAVSAGAELVLSCNASNLDWATQLDAELVAIPDEPHVVESLDRTIAYLESQNRTFRIDPILEPIGFGFAASLARYYDARCRYPEAEIMMGVGNLTELTEADSSGVNMLLAGLCQELGIRSVLTTEVINWARTAVREFDIARRIVFHSISEQTLPKRLGEGLALLRDDPVHRPTANEIEELAEKVTDRNFRILVDGQEVHVLNRDGHWSGTDPYELFDRFTAESSSLDAAHAFYLGYELSKAAPHWPVTGPEGLLSDFSRDEYIRTVERVIEYIVSGDVFQANLSQRLLFPLRQSPDELYRRLRTENPAPFAGYFAHNDWAIASASPERFLRVAGREVETRPIKGTRRRAAGPEADLFTRDALRESDKDQAENVMIVDLLRNDLSRVCRPGSLRVPQLCAVETFETVQHLVSEVRGELELGRDTWDLLAATFPGGSITGAPKVRAMEILSELEPTARGPYCGSLFYTGFDGTTDSNILIRTFICRNGWIQCPVGGGVIAQSDPVAEYEETMHKAEGMLRVLIDGR
eukprot:g8328.t1